MIDETSWEAELVVEDGKTEAKPELVPDTEEETVAEEPKEEPEDKAEAKEEVTEEDPFLEYRDSNGLINGKYKTIADVLKANAEAQRIINEKELEARRAKEQAERYAPQEPQWNPLIDFVPIVRIPPLKQLNNETFIRYGEAHGIVWTTDDDGYVDAVDPVNLGNATYVTRMMEYDIGETKQKAIEYEETAKKAEQQFFSMYPELQNVKPLVEEVSTQLAQGGRFANDFAKNAELLARSVKTILTKALESEVTQAKPKTQEPPVKPVGGTARSGVGTSVDDDVTKW